MAGTITVVGSGTVAAVPDLMRVTITAQVVRPRVAEAFAGTSRSAVAIVDTLRRHGVADTDLSTTGLTIQTETEWHEKRGHQAVGYTASTTLTITVRNLDEASPHPPSRIIADCVEAGGDDVRIGGLELGFADPAALLEAARANAWADALTKAEQYAALAGTVLGEVEEIVEDPASTAPPRPVAQLMRAAAAAMPVERGESALGATIRVRWRLG